MYLHKIISTGFKSFADKVTLQLEPQNITGLIGPNGSGKSNIIDGVRWVMGEQSSRNLRGDSSTDLIFSGAAKRKSLGMAEVTLIFDNQSLSSFCPPQFRHTPEIALTRRVYRDGTKEALINGQKCRLKDLLAFFESAGMGGRGYSIIQQGQVGQILKAKPSELKAMIDEMAGVREFQNKKELSQANMEQTQKNLRGVDGLLEDLVARKEVLFEQAKAARRYEELQKNIRTSQLLVFAHDITQARHREKKARELTCKLSGELGISRSEMSRLQRYKTQLSEQFSNTEDALSSAGEDIARIRERMAGLESSISHHNTLQKQHHNHHGELVDTLKTDRHAAMEYREQLAHKSQEYTKALTTSEHERGLWKEIKQSQKQRHQNLNHIAQQLKQLQRESEELQRKLLVHELSMQHTREELEKNHSELSSVKATSRHLSEELSRRKIDGESYRLRCERFKSELQNKVAQGRHHREQLAKLEAQREAKASKREQLISEKARINSEIHLCEKMLATKERESDDLRWLTGQDHRGAMVMLSDVVRLTSDAHQLPDCVVRALDYWLTRATYFLSLKKSSPVRDVEELMSLWIQKTSKEDGSPPLRITLSGISLSDSLLPPTSPDQSDLGHSRPSASGESSPEGKLVSTWQKCYPRYLRFTDDDHRDQKWATGLQSLYYCPDASLKASYEDIKERVIILPSGALLCYGRELFWPGTGGGEKTLFELKKELATLTSSLEDARERLAEHRRGEQTLRQRGHKLSEDRKSHDDELRVLEHRLNEERSKARAFDVEFKRLTQEEHTSTERLHSLEKKQAQLEPKLTQLNEEIATARERTPQVQEEIKKHQSEEEELKKIINAQRKNYERSQISYSAAQTKAEVLKKSTEELRAYLASVERRVTEKEQQIERESREVSESIQAHKELREELAHLTHGRSEKEQLVQNMREKHEGRKKDLRQLEDKITALAERLSDQKVEKEKQDQAQTVATETILEITQKLRDEYQREVDDLPFEELSGEFNRDAHADEISGWRRDLSSLGAINFVANTEHEALEQKEKFLLAQKKELENALEVLEKAIAESEEMAQEKFQQTFSALNDSFAEIFPILFPRGSAELVLLHPSSEERKSDAGEKVSETKGETGQDERAGGEQRDELDYGVEIMVQLPGKRRQPLNLFSGGEKALTAIALIFSFLKTKPTPFCLLDEVDAPLDEANVARYNELLIALQDRFQFLVISHNRKTMEAFDAVYGVTMQEPGVSKVVSVDLDKRLPSHLKKDKSHSAVLRYSAPPPAPAVQPSM